MFGSIGADNGDQPCLSLEPSAGLAFAYDGGLASGLALGADLTLRCTDHDESVRQRPWVGARLGADLLLVGSLAILPTADVTLSW